MVQTALAWIDRVAGFFGLRFDGSCMQPQPIPVRIAAPQRTHFDDRRRYY